MVAISFYGVDSGFEEEEGFKESLGKFDLKHDIQGIAAYNAPCQLVKRRQRQIGERMGVPCLSLR